MSDGCPRCDEYSANGSTFCGACGRRLDAVEPAPQSGQGFLRTVLSVACALVVAVLVFEIITLILNTPDVTEFLSDKIYKLFLLLPMPTVIFSISGSVLQIYWILVVAAVLISAGYAIWKLIFAIRSKKDRPVSEKLENTSLYWTGLVISLSLFVNFVLLMITTAFGNEIVVPDFGDKIEQMFLLAEASVWEELVTRFLYIGVPMAIISLIVTRKKESLKCLFGGFGMSKAALVLIIISGLIFGAAHYSGWDDQLWKVVATSIMGMLLGYVFVRFGLYAAILLHFINNYMSSFSWMGVGGIENILTLMLIVLGAIAALYVLLRVIDPKGSIRTMPLFRNAHSKEE